MEFILQTPRFKSLLEEFVGGIKFARAWRTSQNPQINPVDERFKGKILQAEGGQFVVVGEPGEPCADDSIVEKSGLERAQDFGAVGRRFLPRGTPAKRAEQIHDRLNPGEDETGAVPVVGQASEHPGARRDSEVEGDEEEGAKGKSQKSSGTPPGRNQ